MKTLTYASLLMLTGAALVLVADPATACPMPTSGTGLATCEGSSFSYTVTTTDGPVCWNALCPGAERVATGGTCAQVWTEGDATKPLCVPVTFSTQDE